MEHPKPVLVQVVSRKSAPDTQRRKDALEDARSTQKRVYQDCSDLNIPLPRFQLDELLGHGTIGPVYKATDPYRRQTVAVRIIHSHRRDDLHGSSCTVLIQAQKEINTLKLLSTQDAKNVNPIIDTLLIGNSMWVITEYGTIGSVATLMVPFKGLAAEWTIPIVREATEAVRWIHDHGVVHGNIKCSNLLVTNNGGVLLCDFAVPSIINAQRWNSDADDGQFRRRAPELMRSDVEYGSPAVDVWGLGTMAFEMAYGCLPGAETEAYPPSIASQPPGDSPPKCPRTPESQETLLMRDMIDRCTRTEPPNRLSMQEVQEHPCISKTLIQYPSSNILGLIEAFRAWVADEDTDSESQPSPPIGGHSGLEMQSDPLLDSGQNAQSATPCDGSLPGQCLPGSRLCEPSYKYDPLAASRRYKDPSESLIKLGTPSTPIESVFDQGAPSTYMDSATHTFYNLCAPLPLDDPPSRQRINSTSPILKNDRLISSLSPEACSDLKPGDLKDLVKSSHPIAKGWTFASALKEASPEKEPVSPKTLDCPRSDGSLVETNTPPEASLLRGQAHTPCQETSVVNGSPKATGPLQVSSGLQTYLDDLDDFLLDQEPPKAQATTVKKLRSPSAPQDRFSTITLIDWNHGQDNGFGHSLPASLSSSGTGPAEQLSHWVIQEDFGCFFGADTLSRTTRSAVEDWLEASFKPSGCELSQLVCDAKPKFQRQEQIKQGPGISLDHRPGSFASEEDIARPAIQCSLGQRAYPPPVLAAAKPRWPLPGKSRAMQDSPSMRSEAEAHSAVPRGLEQDENAEFGESGNGNFPAPPLPPPPLEAVALGASSREDCIVELQNLLISFAEHLQYVSDVGLSVDDKDESDRRRRRSMT